jgi:flagellar basal body-associated protein FliL
MPPSNQFPSPQQSSDQSPYDFFMEPQKTGGRGFGGASGKKLLFIIGAGLVALVLIIMVASLIFSNKDTSTASLIPVAQAQQEMIRVAANGAKNAQATKLQNYSVTVTVSLASEQRDLLAYLKKHGVKVSPASLGLTKNPRTDQALAAAQASSTYDTTYVSVMKSQIDGYEAQINAAKATATSKTQRDLLQKQFNHAELYRSQLLAQ